MQHPVCQSLQKEPLSPRVSEKPVSGAHCYGRRIKRVPVNPVKKKIRFVFKKKSEVRFTSHLDTMRIFIRALRMAKIPVALSQGYHTHLKISMGPPLPLGYTSQAEYADIELADNLPRQFDELLNRSLPEGFEVTDFRLFIRKTSSLNSAISLASYRIYGEGLEQFHSLDRQIHDFLKLNSYKIKREKKGTEISVDIRPYVVSLSRNGKDLELLAKIGADGGSVKAEEVLQVLISKNEPVPEEIYFERSGLFIEGKKSRRTPLEVLEEN
jgi:radical SAM-linked protein